MNAQTKHTPGPWKLETELTPDGSDMLVVSQDYELVADCRSGLSTPRTTAMCEEAEANARLIAASPELLEACRYAGVALRAFQANETNGNRHALIIAEQQLASAYVKATGGSQ